jgi:hypothetical protein
MRSGPGWVRVYVLLLQIACLCLVFTVVLVAAVARHVISKAEKEVLMWEALRMATDEEMERDPTVCVMGAHITRCTGGSKPIGPETSHKYAVLSYIVVGLFHQDTVQC